MWIIPCPQRRLVILGKPQPWDSRKRRACCFQNRQAAQGFEGQLEICRCSFLLKNFRVLQSIRLIKCDLYHAPCKLGTRMTIANNAAQNILAGKQWGHLRSGYSWAGIAIGRMPAVCHCRHEQEPLKSRGANFGRVDACRGTSKSLSVEIHHIFENSEHWMWSQAQMPQLNEAAQFTIAQHVKCLRKDPNSNRNRDIKVQP